MEAKWFKYEVISPLKNHTQVAVDIKLTKTPISGATTNTTRGYIPKMRPISVPEAFIFCALKKDETSRVNIKKQSV